MALGAALAVAKNVSAWAESHEIQEILQKTQQRIDELEGQVNQLKEGSAEGGEGGSASVSDLSSRVETLEPANSV